MEIKHLKTLQENPKRYSKDEAFQFPNEGLSLHEIESLEKDYNQGKQFFPILRELLFLSGKFSYVFDMSDYGKDLQVYVRAELAKWNNNLVAEPFFAVAGSSVGSTFLMVRLDSGSDPNVFDVSYIVSSKPSLYPTIEDTGYSLSQYVEHTVRCEHDPNYMK